LSGLKRGFLFTKLAFQTAIKLPDFLKGVGTYFLGVLILTIIIFIPIGLTRIFLGTEFWGMALIGGLGTLLICALVLWAEVNSLRTALQFDVQQTGKALETDNVKILERKGWQEVLQFNLVHPSLLPAVWFRKQSKAKTLSSSEREDRKLWLDGLYLMKPLISIESLKLKDAVIRINDLISKNLLRFNPELIKVKQIGGGIALFFLLAGPALGIFTGVSIVGEGIPTFTEKIMGTGVGLIISSLMASLGIWLNVTLQTIYNTAIYRWMVDVDAAKGKSKSAQMKDSKKRY